MVMFTAHLSVTIKRLTRYNQKSSIGCHVGGHTTLALQHGGQYKSHYFVEKSECHKISPLNAFPLKFWMKDNFYMVCQFLASARFQLIVKRKHWSRDLLVQVACCHQIIIHHFSKAAVTTISSCQVSAISRVENELLRRF